MQKPATKAKIEREIDNLRYPVKNLPAKYIKAQCFGHFEVFVGDEPLKFKYQKKELLAILIDRNGATLTSGELMAILWEDGYCESFNARMRDEFLNGELFGNMYEAQVLTAKWV